MGKQRVAGRAQYVLGLDRSKFEAGIKASRRRLMSLSRSAISIGQAVGGAGLAISGAFGGALKVFADSGDRLDKLNQRTGISVERLSQLGFAAERSGSSLSAVENGTRGLARTMLNANQGLTTATDTLDALGLSVEDLNRLSPDQQFDAFAQAIANVADPTERAGLSMRVFGRAGQELLPLLNGGVEGINALASEADRLGVTMSGQSATSAAMLTDAMGDLWTVVGAVTRTLGEAVAGPVTAFVNLIASSGRVVIDFVSANQGLVQIIAGVGLSLFAAGTLITGFGLGAAALSAALGGILTVASALSVAFAAIVSPIGLTTVAVLGGVTAFLRYTEVGQSVVRFFVDNFNQVFDVVSNTIGGIQDALSAGDMALAAEIGLTGVKLVFATVLESVLGIFGSSIGEMSKLLAELFKQIGTVVSRINSARVTAINFLTEIGGNLVGVDTSIERQAATRSAKAFENSFKQIDTNRLGQSLADAFDPAKLEEKLASLNRQAETAKDIANAVEFGPELPPGFSSPQVPTDPFAGLQNSSLVRGSLSVASLSQQSSGSAVDLLKELVRATKDQTTKVEEQTERLAGSGATFS